MTPTTYGRDFAYCLKSHGGVRGFNASLWRFLLRCTLFCHSVATFLTSVSSYEGGCGFEDIEKLIKGEGPFAQLGEDVFDDYWMGYFNKDDAQKAGIGFPHYNNLKTYKEYLESQANKISKL